jgi:DNA-binding NarL/FixJ family response regulator
VSKAQPFEHLLDAAESVLRNRPLLGDAEYEELMQLGRVRLEAEREVKQGMAQLTVREREVLWALSEGESAGDIAKAFVVSIGTVRSHIQGILGKLGVSSQLAAVARARLLLTPDDAPRRLRQR